MNDVTIEFPGTPAQLAKLRERIASGRQPEGARHLGYEHGRGWNDALDFVERMIKEIEGEKAATA